MSPLLRTSCRIVLGLSLLVMPAFASAQGLGDLAKKEQKRRAGVTTPGKVYTGKDLPPSAQKPAPPPAAPAAPDNTASEQAAPPPAAQEEKNEAWWRARIGKVREQVRRDEAFQEALQSRLNALNADYLRNSSPSQRARITEDRNKAIAEMERLVADIAQGKQQITEIEEEARREGVPPGWLR